MTIHLTLLRWFKGGLLYEWWMKLRSAKVVITLLVLFGAFYFLRGVLFKWDIEPSVQTVVVPAILATVGGLLGWFFKLRSDDKELISNNGLLESTDEEGEKLMEDGVEERPRED